MNELLKERFKKEGNETVTNCHGLKMTAAALEALTLDYYPSP